MILLAGATELEYRDLANEVEIMGNVGEHLNLINLIGVCSLKGQFPLKYHSLFTRFFFIQAVGVTLLVMEPLVLRVYRSFLFLLLRRSVVCCRGVR